MDSTTAIDLFRTRFTMYANTKLEAVQNGQNWDIYLQSAKNPIGYVTPDGNAHLY